MSKTKASLQLDTMPGQTIKQLLPEGYQFEDENVHCLNRAAPTL